LLKCLIEAADAAEAARQRNCGQRQVCLMNELLRQQNTARLRHCDRRGSKMLLEQTAQLTPAHSEASGQRFDAASIARSDAASIERSALDQCERARYGCRRTAPSPEIGRALGTAAQTGAKAGFLSRRRGRHKDAVLEFRVPSRANRAAVDAGGFHTCEEPPVVARIAREHSPVTGDRIQLHEGNIGRTAPISGGFRTSLPGSRRLVAFYAEARRRRHSLRRHSRESGGLSADGNGLLCPDRNQPKVVMRGLEPRIHAVTGIVGDVARTWMDESSPAMTTLSCTSVIAHSDPYQSRISPQ
jgi:hypothetical protein